MNLTFAIPGPPKPLARHRTRLVLNTCKPFAQTYDPAENVSHKAYIAFHAQQAMRDSGGWKDRLDGPLRLSIEAYMERPKSAPKKRLYPVTKPDFDNLAKMICDALNKIVWRDDAQICECVIVKRYATGLPYTRVAIDEIGELV